ncbi:DNA (cytosine-5-)-methyltransferase [Lactiplantibacillus plantarum]|uniref:DNA (cytosine-5-)-methyltransferase n=1 Tax=Lactiplantibacillus plantarum TaxID=1590 RepID=UPI000FED0CFD|nr:DNA (cytosine-5-)-methyltransferase [Lactiplantibacillus plantarum]RWZ68811.1 DNA (cytosine-5-)-methyltransferase [Lactiplantibacillus plantarum]RWZ68822.1 DNA (cytosine-5-)-methyltransferase [Lactiplantibacillus plantarum]
MSPIAEQIKAKRQRLSMTQKELADTIGLGRYGDRTVRRWECDESTPSKLELNAILKFPEKAPFTNPEKYDYSMIDLFAGIGGTRLGFYQTKRVGNVFSSEWDKFSQKTYQANFGEMPEGDITKIQAEDIPDHDILVGGFPCQAFSQAGKKLGFEDTRGTLFFDVARIIKGKRPKAFLLENVKNLKNHDHGRTFKAIMNTLIDLDYNVYYTTFHARDFGIPQNRERIYIVGFDKHQVSSHDTFRFPLAPKKETHVGDILEPNSSVDEKYTISDKLWEGHKRRKAENKAKGNGFGYSIFTADSPYTNTISARYYKDGSEILIKQEGRNPRKLTPREAARLQGFPENYIIPVSDTQAYKEFGNSVCVPVIHAIAEQVLDVLDHSIGAH